MSTAGPTIQNAKMAGAALEAIHGKIEPVRTSTGYIAGMSLVALVMVLLPLLYLALIGAVAALLWFHATHSHVVFEHVRGRNAKGALLVYLGPLAIGGIVLLFMVKPLFAPRRRETEPLTLDPKQEPLLFAFVKKLCAAVHAPAPREIRIDTEVNASAGLRRGFWSLFGHDLTLTIGLPLAAGMSLRQLAGVLAHEFGHFSQGAGMRLTFIIRSISFWFVRVVYERDAWDEWLKDQAAGTGGWVYGVVQLARACVWLTRRILWVLMWIGNLVSCFMLRQMEFDADRHEARFAGSQTFQQT
ncbi:MAG TPA: M48 family metallopeptidase, partial [Planctomycetaceae bacterium]